MTLFSTASLFQMCFMPPFFFFFCNASTILKYIYIYININAHFISIYFYFVCVFQGRLL